MEGVPWGLWMLYPSTRGWIFSALSVAIKLMKPHHQSWTSNQENKLWLSRCRDSGFSVTRKAPDTSWCDAVELHLRRERFRAKTACVLSTNTVRNKAQSIKKGVWEQCQSRLHCCRPWWLLQYWNQLILTVSQLQQRSSCFSAGKSPC